MICLPRSTRNFAVLAIEDDCLHIAHVKQRIYGIISFQPYVFCGPAGVSLPVKLPLKQRRVRRRPMHAAPACHR